MERRKFIKTSLTAGVGLGLLGGLYSWKIEPFWLDFNRVKMPIKNLPKQLIGKTLMQISDLHVGNRFDYNYIIKSLIEAQKYNPDFVVYTGDYVSYESNEQIGQLKKVMQHATHGSMGTFGILGNHDYGKNWADQEVADSISEVLKNNKIHLLSNSKSSKNGLNFIGLDDLWALNFNPKKILSSINNKQANIVLCHNPDVCDLDVWGDYSGWILAGHTHGGQVKAPFLDPFIVPVKNKRYTSGEFDLSNERTLYINRALGHLWPVRFNVRPEITIFKLENIV
ncbi:MAG: phosphoesterase [Flavobacteriales bacterium]|nr:phosphoesterase [Flavobacteriales bacterium]|tara:strand:- start:1100 stop:1945 length:846 start_codon:yes stop_codon:yes gene_type:complete